LHKYCSYLLLTHSSSPPWLEFENLKVLSDNPYRRRRPSTIDLLVKTACFVKEEKTVLTQPISAIW
jgi:hypothetical protein